MEPREPKQRARQRPRSGTLVVTLRLRVADAQWLRQQRRARGVQYWSLLAELRAAYEAIRRVQTSV